MTACVYFAQKVTGDFISITDRGQIHHLRDVLRLVPGDEVIVFDTENNEYQSVICSLDRKQLVLTVRSRRPAPVGKLRVAIACAIPKKSRMDDIIDMLTQLGVDTIIPMKTDRVVVKLEEDRETRLERWRRIARSAAEQSRRNTLPVITPVMSLAEVLVLAKEYDLKLVPNLAGTCKSIREVNSGPRPAAVMALIGPEGDFTPAEIEEAVKAGFIPVSLGDTVLRVETAAVGVAAYLKMTLAG
ncbi:MAG: RsmE family RNA methyltransferase [Dehalococcoidales bacterium]|nr:RsmE family RNA methyltransferase [Dehalococcoidales bacterium]